MENYFKLSFSFVVYTQHCKIIGAIYIREGGGRIFHLALKPSPEHVIEGLGLGLDNLQILES